MAKKSFISENPALSFISQSSIDQAEKQQEGTQAPARRIAPAPEGYRINPQYIEKRTRRVQLTLQPSLYEAVKEKAGAQRISFNEAVCLALEDYIAKER